MNRPLKFRYWDGKGTMMDWCCVMQTAFNQVNVATQRAAQHPFESLLYRLFWRHSLSDGDALMQFIGILDKHGREIYEGDLVVAWSAGSRATLEVRWSQPIGRFFLYRELGSLNWNLSGSALAREDGRLQDDGVEIIGNIYEHPEIWAQTKRPAQ